MPLAHIAWAQAAINFIAFDDFDCAVGCNAQTGLHRLEILPKLFQILKRPARLFVARWRPAIASLAGLD
jgi:hypothetical protein